MLRTERLHHRQQASLIADDFAALTISKRSACVAILPKAYPQNLTGFYQPRLLANFWGIQGEIFGGG